jgi:hypothetical protein
MKAEDQSEDFNKKRKVIVYWRNTCILNYCGKNLHKLTLE